MTMLRLAMAALGAVLASASASADGPSFDCAKASNAVEDLVCGDAQLAAMDTELARLYDLAMAGGDMTEGNKDALRDAQRAWIETRDRCGGDDLRMCVELAYLGRIEDLRQTYASARNDDDKGISLGPFAVTCQGVDGTAVLIFVNTDPSVAYLDWPGDPQVLTQTMSGSGARYAAETDGGEIVFWNKGNEAQYQRPGHDDATCRLTKVK